MDKVELLKKIKEIGTCEDDVQRRTLVAEVHDEVSNTYAEYETLQTDHETLKTTNKKFEEDNETLRQANMKLFLRVGNDKSEQQQQQDTTGVQKPDESKRKFEDLFNEKGGLK